jgi:predicted ATPase
VPRRYVLTGAPGSGKTSLLQALAARGWAVVHEAATDVIALVFVVRPLGLHADPLGSMHAQR